jgi:hypothetical protein
MEELWLKVSKPAKDGNRYILLKGLGDIGFLYATGFVDVQKFSFKDWMDSFLSSRQKDGSFVITKPQWMEKKKFRYEGKIEPPFDAFTIEEKEYTESELTKLLTDKIIPNTIYNQSYIPQVLNNLRAQKKLVNGKIRIDREMKEFIHNLINTYPSPKRILELMVGALKYAKDNKYKMSQLGLQKSAFAAGSAAEKIVQARLSEIAKEIHAAEAPAPTGPTVSLKDLQKKRPGGGRI